MTAVPGLRLPETRLRFAASDPTRTHAQAFLGLKRSGPFSSAGVELSEGSVLFVFPKPAQQLAHSLAEAFFKGSDRFPGFERMFRVPIGDLRSVLTSLAVEGDLRDPAQAAQRYRETIGAWSREREPALALVVVPHTERWQSPSAYSETKAAFAMLGVPTQMATVEMLQDPSRAAFSTADIALASFAKLGGVPWTIEAPAGDRSLIVGVGRSDVGPRDERRRVFGYAVSFVANGMYRQINSVTPTSDNELYEQRLEEALVDALNQDLDEQPDRIVIHLSRTTGAREIDAVERAMLKVGIDLPVAFLRLDDSSIWDIADTGQDTFAPPKGLMVRLGPRRALLQVEELANTGAPDGPLLVELNERSTVGPEELERLVAQTYRLAHASWRKFSARSRPATLVYGEQLASLVGQLEDVEAWDPKALRSELRTRPWFL